MSIRSIAAFLSQKKPLPLHRTYWRTVPLRRLSSLLLALFCMFGMIGCFVDLLDQGRKPFLPVIAWSIFSGVLAVVWILVFFRGARGWLIAVILFWIVGSRLLSDLLRHSGPFAFPTPEQGTRVATIA
jgi:hypothetical protein